MDAAAVLTLGPAILFVRIIISLVLLPAVLPILLVFPRAKCCQISASGVVPSPTGLHHFWSRHHSEISCFS